MGLSKFDRELLSRCLNRQSGSWEHFTDRFAGVMMAVVTHVANAREIRTTVMDREDIVSHVFTVLIEGDFKVLRAFKGNSSLYTYLSVVVRRIAIRQLTKLARKQRLEREQVAQEIDHDFPLNIGEEGFDDLLESLDAMSSELVRLRYVQELPYSEISKRLSIPENSIGPMLSRAREKIRESLSDSEI
ncbi:MAG: sigma-70 family RNA polymerase sigma factor [Pirellulaceae bacterium]|nr:sigma-70 family RNA polymerase sigma factor [Mariniblastus sp.]MDB4756677.1 sigma-70 family RNA polymerase sigma factor [Mariniblastus sp.]MDG2469369.1 sigma-70 family RNA polymerase sigma factor [Pirellulaceae bacterium]